VDAVFAAAGTGTSVGLNIGSGKKLKLVGDVIDTNGNELLKVTATASAVNEVTLANAATGGTPTITASGDDTNIGMKFVGKGTGEVTARVNGSDVFNASSNFGFKNRIINGAMVIDQRNAGAVVTPTSGQYLTDRYVYEATQASKLTAQQNAGAVTPPVGFTKYLGVTSSSAYSVLTGDTFLFSQRIEGFNVADLAFGTASAATVTLSFWVRSSLTGTFGGSLCNGGLTRSYPFSYTISSANTWEQKTITVAGDTSGTWATDNTAGLNIRFGLGSGATYSGTSGAWASANYVQPTSTTSVVGTNGATFYITGVQLEKGSTATSFDYRPYGTELALCQRYCPAFSTANGVYASGYSYSTTNSVVYLNYLVSTRVPGTSITTTGTFFTLNGAGAGVTLTALTVNSSGTTNGIQLNCQTASGLTAGQGTMLGSVGATTIIVNGCEL